MRKKGFTLIELLGVIVILAAIASIAFPIVTGIIKSNKEKAYNEQLNALVSATKAWFTDNNDFLPETGEYYMDELTLKGNGYLKNLLIDPRNGKDLTACVRISYSNEYSQYTYEATDDCPNTLGKNVMANYPNLKLGPNGCENENKDENKNYSYMQGCFLTDNNDDKFVWYSGFMWEIVGINNDGSIKLISTENLSSVYENSLSYEDSQADKWLNDYFFSRLVDSKIIVNGKWCVDKYDDIPTLDNVKVNCSNIINRRVGLLTADEFLLGGSKFVFFEYPLKTRVSDLSSYLVDGFGIEYSKSLGRAYRLFSSSLAKESRTLRPVINVRSNTIIASGTGIQSDPYNITDFSSASNQLLTNYAVTGSYVKFANRNYRIVKSDSEGNVELTAVYFYGDTYRTQYPTNDFLNTYVLNYIVSSTDSENLEKIYQNYAWNDSIASFQYDYKEYIKPSGKITTQTVSMPVFSEILTAYGKELSGEPYWTSSIILEPEEHYGYSFICDDVPDQPILVSQVYGGTSSIRPLIMIKKDVKIISGNGTPGNPFVI